MNRLSLEVGAQDRPAFVFILCTNYIKDPKRSQQVLGQTSTPNLHLDKNINCKLSNMKTKYGDQPGLR
ncbi:hypothetical protein BVRB_6g149120 [Beta vulgaris subsp. vulgaris]|nr:hypothetical protein BVRB_6g149120 [Beta vulgaris subsp. vulgaris]